MTVEWFNVPVAERVAKGVALIVSKGYSLADIDLDRLDMESWEDCIVGQLLGNYGARREAWGIESGAPYGFIWVDAHEIPALHVEWECAVHAARQAG